MSALLFGGTVLLFSRALRCGFVNYDDPAYVTDNVHVQGGLSWAGVEWAFTAPTDYWHPLTWLSHMLDWQLYGPAAFGHHLTSVLWHALNATLAFLLFRRLGAGLWLGAFAAALFAWHPLRVESVVWVTERKDVMSGCFFLLTLLAYARYVDCRSAGRSWWRAYLLTLACFAAGLMSKPMLVTLPLVLLVLDFWPFARFRSPAGLRRLLLEKVPFFVLAGAAAVATVLMQRHTGSFVLNLPLGARSGNAVVSVARYLGKFLWPFDLIVCYPHPGYWPAPAVLAAAALVLGLSWLAWRERRRRPWIAAGWLWFLVVLLPAMGLIQVGFQAMADRYTYLPLLGIEVAALWSLAPALRTQGGAHQRSAVRQNGGGDRPRGGRRAHVEPGGRLARFGLAFHPRDRRDGPQRRGGGFPCVRPVCRRPADEAAVHAERARALNPRNAMAPVTLAGVRERQGRPADAAELLRAALALRPVWPEVQCQLGLLDLRLGRTEEARGLMTPALRSTPALRERTLESPATRCRAEIRGRRFFSMISCSTSLLTISRPSSGRPKRTPAGGTSRPPTASAGMPSRWPRTTAMRTPPSVPCCCSRATAPRVWRNGAARWSSTRISRVCASGCCRRHTPP